MSPTIVLRSVQKLIFQITFSIGAVAILVWMSVALQAGNSGIYLFVINDVTTNPERLSSYCAFQLLILRRYSPLNMSFDCHVLTFLTELP